MMRSSHVLPGVAVALVVAGCAHESEGSHAAVVASVPPEREAAVRLTDEGMPEPEPPRAPPRLSRTITLGQGQSEPVYGTPPQAPLASPTTPSVVVNNNVTVVGAPPVVVGGYYGGAGARGYGGYGGRGGAARDASRAPSGTTSSARGAWAPNGWEGAGRTAAPGATPGIGGNWAPAPSFGPRQMK